MRMTFTGNHFTRAERPADVAAVALGEYGTFSDNIADPDALIQILVKVNKQSANILKFKDMP